VGGEGEALKRLQRFSLERPSHAVTKAKVSNSSEPAGDSLYGADFSCKISPWLSMGCLSPRRMFEDLKNGSRLVLYMRAHPIFHCLVFQLYMSFSYTRLLAMGFIILLFLTPLCRRNSRPFASFFRYNL
jgi:deoxyribodipyrimidine photolyase